MLLKLCASGLLAAMLGSIMAAVLAQDDDMVVENEQAQEQLPPVFIPTNDWQIIESGQAIPAGLHIRMDLQTGLKEAKLMDGSKFTGGDQRRVGNHGYSDRRGVVNKRSKVFTKEEYLAMLRESSTLTPTHPLHAITSTHPLHALTPTHPPPTLRGQPADRTLTSVTLHGEVVSMLELVRCLGDEWQQSAEVVRLLDELEYHVHEIDNGRDLVRVGGLPVLLRLLNHTHSDVQSGAALVLGSAAQSNPMVQDSLVLLEGVSCLCALLSSSSEETMRRGLFALGALMRDRHSHLLSECRELHSLRGSFDHLSDRVKLKVTTLLSDMAPQVDTHWCEQVSSLVYSDSDTLVEGGLVAMTRLHCDPTQHVTILKHLINHHLTHRTDILEPAKYLLSQSQQLKREL